MTDRVMLVDMDGVLCDLVGYTLKRLFEKGFTPLPYAAHLNYEMGVFYAEDARKAIREIWHTSGTYANLDPVPGAVEGFKYLASQYDVHIVTHVLTPIALMEKLGWVESYLGVQWRDRVKPVFDDDKTVFNGLALIDDKPFLRGSIARPTFRHIVFTQPWNAQLDSVLRLDGWVGLNVLPLLLADG